MNTIPAPKNKIFLDLTGNKYGRLTVISLNSKMKMHYKWNCSCDCGGYTAVTGTDLKTGHTSSCGCLALEGISKLNLSHGMSKTRTYNSWLSMNARCSNVNNRAYNSYGGRGIAVCDRWASSFEAFLADMGERPKNKSIDRIDNSKGYSPDNCRWATGVQQNRNRRPSRGAFTNGVSFSKTKNKWIASITINGKKKHIAAHKDAFEAVCARKSAENKYWITPTKAP